jgi:hypothetical protein
VRVRPRDEPAAEGTWVKASSLREVGAKP